MRTAACAGGRALSWWVSHGVRIRSWTRTAVRQPAASTRRHAGHVSAPAAPSQGRPAAAAGTGTACGDGTQSPHLCPRPLLSLPARRRPPARHRVDLFHHRSRSSPGQTDHSETLARPAEMTADSYIITGQRASWERQTDDGSSSPTRRSLTATAVSTGTKTADLPAPVRGRVERGANNGATRRARCSGGHTRRSVRCAGGVYTRQRRPTAERGGQSRAVSSGR